MKRFLIRMALLAIIGLAFAGPANAEPYEYKNVTGSCKNVVDKIPIDMTDVFVIGETPYVYAYFDFYGYTVMRVVFYNTADWIPIIKPSFTMNPPDVPWKNAIVWTSSELVIGSYFYQFQVLAGDSFMNVNSASGYFSVTDKLSAQRHHYLLSSNPNGDNLIQFFNGQCAVTKSKRITLGAGWVITRIKKLSNGNGKIFAANDTYPTSRVIDTDWDFNPTNEGVTYGPYPIGPCPELTGYFKPIDDHINNDGSGVMLFEFQGNSFMMYHDARGKISGQKYVGPYDFQNWKVIRYAKGMDGSGRLVYTSFGNNVFVAKMIDDRFKDDYFSFNIPVAGSDVLSYEEYENGGKHIFAVMPNGQGYLYYYENSNVALGNCVFNPEPGYTFTSFGNY